MNIEIKILELLKSAKDLGKGGLQIQNIDLLLMKSGEREFLGIFLLKKMNEMIRGELISKEKSQYVITAKGLNYLSPRD